MGRQMRISTARPRLNAWLALALSILLAGCGAGVGGPASQPAQPPTGPIAAASAMPTDAPGDVGGEATPAASAAPTATQPRTPAPSTTAPSAAPSSPRSDPFSLDLYRAGDFVGQYTFEWCVGASVQMTLNMLRPKNDRSKATQERLWERARDLSDSVFGGANPNGWVPLLNELGIGDWQLVSAPTLDEAVRDAAKAIRATKRPVNLVMWRGRHAWVMSGFTSLGDPAATDDFEVTGVNVLDPLHPHGSSVWGSSPRPNSLLTPAELGEQFVPRTSGRIDLGVAPGYLLILPVG
jgi:hypothetical protein